MSRRIKITIEDVDTKRKMSSSIYLEDVNSLYEDHKINGITHLVDALNKLLNKEMCEDVKLLLDTNLNP